MCVLFALEPGRVRRTARGRCRGSGLCRLHQGRVLDQDMSASVPRVHYATIAALKEADFPVTEDIHDKLSAKVQSRFVTGLRCGSQSNLVHSEILPTERSGWGSWAMNRGHDRSSTPFIAGWGGGEDVFPHSGPARSRR